MAVLAFSAVGAAAGASIAGSTMLPLWASTLLPSLGWTLGGMVGQAIQGPTELPAVSGPTLTDTKVQSASYGKTIPIGYGHPRVAGQLIWSTDLIQTANVQQVNSGGGKGGGGGTTQTQVTYTYSASFAIAIMDTNGTPIIGLRRIWANGRLIYNVSDDASSDTLMASSDAYTLYPGSLTQNPDPLMESVKGVGNVPAYRGVAYVVFNNMQLATYSNRIPNFEFEIVTEGFGTVSQTDMQLYYTIPSSGQYITDPGNAFMIGTVLWAAVNADYYTTQVWNMYGSPGPWAAIKIRGGSRAYTLGPNYDGSLMAMRTDVGGNMNRLYKFTTGGGVQYVDVAVTTPRAGDGWGDAAKNFWCIVTGTTTVVNLRNFRWNNEGGKVTPLVTKTTISTAFNSCRAIRNAAAIAGRFYVRSGTGTGNWGYVTPSSYVSLGSWTSTSQTGCVSYEGYIYLGSGNSGERNRLYKYSADGANLGYVDFPGVSSTTGALINVTVSGANGWAHWSGGTNGLLFKFDAGTLEILETVNLPAVTGWTLLGPQLLEGGPVMLGQVSGSTKQMWLVEPKQRLTLTTAASDLADIVGDIATRSNTLTVADIDTTGLSGTEVHAFTIANRAPARQFLEMLMSAYFFDVVESDWVIKFIKRGQASAVTIPETQMAARQDGLEQNPTPLEITRKQNLELPVQINLAYNDENNNQIPANQPSRRLAVQSDQIVSVTIPLSLTPDEAAKIVDTMLYMMWMGRETVSFTTSRKYMAYEPTDVITIPHDGSNINVLLTKKNNGVGGTVTFEGEVYEQSVFTQVSVGAPSPTPSGTVGLPSPTNLGLLDIPLLRQADDNPGFYFAANGYNPETWYGQQLYQSKDTGASYAALENGQTLAAALMGISTNALGPFPITRNEVFDEKNYVDIQMRNGASLSSYTRTQILNGQGTYLLGNEIIQAMDATLISTDTYRLTRLLRGRLGTEWAMDEHTDSDPFVVLDSSLRSVNQVFTEINQEYGYKAVSIGRSLATTGEIFWTNTGTRSKPLCPWLFAGGRDESGNIYFKWVPRTRYDGAWLDGVNAPIGESQEQYAVVIMNGTTEIRAIGSTTPAAVYTAAQQVEDWGSLQSSVTAYVYQLSPEFGRGYATLGVF